MPLSVPSPKFYHKNATSDYNLFPSHTKNTDCLYLTPVFWDYQGCTKIITIYELILCCQLLVMYKLVLPLGSGKVNPADPYEWPGSRAQLSFVNHCGPCADQFPIEAVQNKQVFSAYLQETPPS
jgi:hypothetical protein